MCGIAGAVGASVDERVTIARTMIGEMAHRGPDSSGVAVVGEAALGMCQLRIREATSRPVPLVGGERGGERIAYNGEIYGGVWKDGPSRELRVPDGVDEEVASILSEAQGRLAPDGMYALAQASEGEPDLSCWRDAFGIKPFYWRRHAGGTLFASEVRALAGVGERPSLRPEAIAEFLLYGRCLEHRTFYAGIESVPPGARMKVSSPGVEVYAVQPSYWRAPRATAVELRAAIREALERTVVSERPVGLALSGGLDSTILAAELSLMGVEGLHTFSVRVAGADDGCGSLAELELPGRAWKTWTHHLVEFGPQLLPRGMASATSLTAEPTRMTSFPLYLVLAEAVKQTGIVVLLCGEGADELFGGYGSYRKWLGLDGALGMGELADYACPSGKRRAVEALLGEHALARASAVFERQFSELAQLPAFEALRRLEQYLRLEPLLHRTDLALMAHSVEGRVPFLHGRVPELAYGLPLPDCLSSEHTKLALRRAYRDVLPPWLTDHPKTNFRAPVASWFAGELAPWVAEEFAAAEQVLVAQGFSPGALRSLAHEATTGDKHRAAMAFGVISLGMLLRGASAESEGA